MKDTLDERKDIAPEVLFNIHYSGGGISLELFNELIEHVASELSLPVKKLRMEDRFSVELATKENGTWDTGYGVLLFELQRFAKKKKIKIDTPIATIDDYIRAMSRVYS